MKKNRIMQTEAELAAFLFGLKLGRSFELYLSSTGPAGGHFASFSDEYSASYWADGGDLWVEMVGDDPNDIAGYAAQGMLAEAEKEAREVFERYAETLANKGAEK